MRRIDHLPAASWKAVVVAVALALPGAASADETERTAVWEWVGVPRVVAVGDLHGAHGKLVRLLRGTGLVDRELRWTGGGDHLVVAGDFLDRGPDDRSVMDLLRRLQDESEAAGGRVHVLLGNHEVMNLLRDTRHVHPVAYRAFARDEKRSERAAAWRRSFPRGMRSTELREFNHDHPRGFFARQRSFEADGEYGAWLLRQPVIVKIDGVVYLHAGLTVEFATLGVDGINRRVLAALTRQLELRSELEAAGVVTPVMDFWEILEAARSALPPDSAVSARTREVAEALLEAASDPVLGFEGPLWYRGNSFEDERIERRIVERSLELLEADAVVVAHSYTGGNKITSRFHGRLLRLDHGILASDRPLALVVERGEALVVDPKSRQATRPIREMPPGSFRLARARELPDVELERVLSEGEVVESRELGRGSTRPRLVVLELEGARHRAVFKTVESPAAPAVVADRYQHEVAAFRLDRRLGLGLVPPTVMRELEGRRGSLQAWVEGAVDQAAAEAYGMKLYDGEEAAGQLALAALFDALIGNRDREPEDVLRRLGGERLYLVDHSRAFPEEIGRVGEGGTVFAVTQRLAEALEALDRASLEGELGDLLSARQIDALLARRDLLRESLVVSAPASGVAPAALASDH